MKVLVAPDKFKGTLTARAAAETIAEAVRSHLPAAEVSLCPLADGGDGTIAALTALGGKIRSVRVTGPMGSAAEAEILTLPDGTVVVESAQTLGALVAQDRPHDPMHATSFGLGETLAAVEDATAILVGIGGTTSTDGGAGMASALGFRFLDTDGREVPRGGAGLLELARIVLADPALPAPVTGLCDVDNPLLGDDGAAYSFGPQKGASGSEVERLDEALALLNARLMIDLGRDVSALPGAGAGGGLGAGVAAFLDARLTSGSERIAELVDLEGMLDSADLVITGEGSVDASSTRGKVPGRLLDGSKARGIPCLMIAGSSLLDPGELGGLGFDGTVVVGDLLGRERSIGDPPGAVFEATVELLRAGGY